jgi:TonB family protein
MSATRALAVTALLLLAPSRAVTAKPATSDPEGLRLLSEANARSAITAPGTSPFRLAASVLVRGEFKGERHGALEVTWLAPDRWRMDVKLPDYTETRVADGGTLRISRVPDDPPDRSEWPGSLVRWRLSEPEPLAGQSVRKPSKRGGRACVPVVDPDATKDFHCVDATTGLVSRIETLGEESYELEDPAPFGGRTFPRTLRIRSGRILAVEIRVTELEALTADAKLDGEVASPDGTWPYCASYRPWLPVSVVVTYPPRAASETLTGLVTIEGTVGADGRVAEGARLVRTSTFDQLDDQVLKAARRWQFDPAQCDGSPVPSPLRLTFDYRLRMYVPGF